MRDIIEGEMKDKHKSPLEILVEKLDRELIARGAQIPAEKRFEFGDREGTPQREAIMTQTRELYTASSPCPDKAFSHISTWELVKILMVKTRELNDIRGIWGEDDRKDFHEITDQQIKKSADCTAAICMKDDLVNEMKGYSKLRVKNYGKAFNLCESEPFRDQPIAAGFLFTGFLVKEDVIATAGHCANEKNVTDFRIVFDFKMSNSNTPVIKAQKRNIYKGVKIIRRSYSHSNGSDWALVKLDRKVLGRPIAKLSKKDILRNQAVYIIGHPLGLPLKYSGGAQIRDIGDTYFAADLNVYCGNSGSPVFDGKTHDVIGIVVRGDNRDFRWTGKGWASIIYPNPDIRSKEPQCTKVSEFIDIVDKL